MNLTAALTKSLRKRIGRPGNQHSAKNVNKNDHFEELGKLGGSTAMPKDQDDNYEMYAMRHRSGIKNRKENQSGKPVKHPGFKSVQKKIQDEGYSSKIAGAILASRTRGASKAAHKANPHLNRVKG